MFSTSRALQMGISCCASRARETSTTFSDSNRSPQADGAILKLHGMPSHGDPTELLWSLDSASTGLLLVSRTFSADIDTYLVATLARSSRLS